MISADEQIFIRSVLFYPDEDEPKLVYADWLEERGDQRAELLRLDVALKSLEPVGPDGDAGAAAMEASPKVRRYRELCEQRRNLLPQLNRDWVQLLTDTPISLCELQEKFGNVCPERWSSLKPIEGETNVRFCSQCAKTVHYCQDKAEAQSHQRRGQCVAVDPAVAFGHTDFLRDEASTQFWNELVLGAWAPEAE